MESPVLFLIFNRPSETEQVFQQIRKAKPPMLFIAADGPRSNRRDDIALCEKTRNVVSIIDWPCDVQHLFRDANLGCGLAVSSAITWFFKNVKEGIILEDDCLPHEDFFEYCDIMLSYYRNADNVKMITGMSYMDGAVYPSLAYYFSRFFSIWGWASWRRAWNKYDFHLEDETEIRIRDARRELGHKDMARWISRNLSLTNIRSSGTWDMQWFFMGFKMNGLCVTPTASFIQNIGIVGAHSNVETYSHSIKAKGVDIEACRIVREAVWDRSIDHMAFDAILKSESTLSARLQKFRYWVIRPMIRRFLEWFGILDTVRRIKYGRR